MAAQLRGSVSRPAPAPGTRDMPSPDLFRALRRLNVLLRSAVARTAEALRVQPGEDLFRGLYVEHDEALAAWDRAAEPPAPGGAGDWEQDCATDPILLLALAPELDPGYERVFGFLLDDVTRRRPTVSLALNLLDPAVASREVV